MLTPVHRKRTVIIGVLALAIRLLAYALRRFILVDPVATQHTLFHTLVYIVIKQVVVKAIRAHDHHIVLLDVVGVLLRRVRERVVRPALVRGVPSVLLLLRTVYLCEVRLIGGRGPQDGVA